LRRNCLLKHVTEGKDRRKDRNEEKTRKKCNSYWITSRKREGTENWKRKN